MAYLSRSHCCRAVAPRASDLPAARGAVVTSSQHRLAPARRAREPAPRGLTTPQAAPPGAEPGSRQPAATYGLFVCSGSPAMAEALSHSGVDWLCLDTQHGAVGYAELAGMLQATASGAAQTIVRVGGPSDRFGIQQALDQGAGGVMVPLVNSVAEAREAVSYCRFPPEGQRSVVAPSRAILVQEGIGSAAAGRYLRAANRRVQVWLQVESVQCLEALDDILGSVPGIDCMFLGPADMAVSMGLLDMGQSSKAAADGGGGGVAAAAAAPVPAAGGGGEPAARLYTDLAAALAGPEMARVHEVVLRACERHGVAAGCFCVGAAAARELASLGYKAVGFDVDVNMAINAGAAAMQHLRKP